MKRFIFILFFVFNSNAFSVFDYFDQTDYCASTELESTAAARRSNNDYGLTLTLVDFVNHPFFEGLFNKDDVRKDLERRFFIHSQVCFYITLPSEKFFQRCLEQMKFDCETSEYQHNIDDIILDKLERAISYISSWMIKKEEIIPVFKEHLDKIFENNLDQRNRILRIFEANIERILRKAYLVQSVNHFTTNKVSFETVKASIENFVTDSTKEEVFKEYLKIQELSNCYNPTTVTEKSIAVIILEKIEKTLSDYKEIRYNPKKSLEDYTQAQKMIAHYTRLKISAVRNPSFRGPEAFKLLEEELKNLDKHEWYHIEYPIASYFLIKYKINVQDIEKIAERYMNVKHALAEAIEAKFPGQFQIAKVVGGGFELIEISQKDTATVATSTEETDSSSKLLTNETSTAE